eukprot:356721-Chlamydomonas_euryale.AAC.5
MGFHTWPLALDLPHNSNKSVTSATTQGQNLNPLAMPFPTGCLPLAQSADVRRDEVAPQSLETVVLGIELSNHTVVSGKLNYLVCLHRDAD